MASAASTTEIVSVASNGSTADGYSSGSSISADGRYITFSSYADNLVAGDNNSCSDIFVRDRVLNTTERISVSNSGEESNGDSYDPSISSDGRYVAYASYATNLVANDNNGYSDVFVYDRLMNITQRVSISNNGEEGNGDSCDPSISADGSYIAFSSSASNLVADDTNGCNDVFVYDRTSNTVKRISISNTGKEGDGDSYEPSISGDGNFIAFTSYADNLINNDTNDCSDVFVYNQTSETIKRISISSNGEQGMGDSYEPSISADGRYIAFTSYADTLIDNDTNGYRDVFVHDQISGATERVSISSEGEQFYKDNYSPSISANGRYITFVSGTIRPRVAVSRTLTLTDDNVDIFVHDRVSKITECVSVSSTGEEANSNSNSPSISANGSFVVFSSSANNLVANDNNYYDDIFIHGIDTSATSAVIYPEIVKSGDQVTIRAYDPNSVNIIALILNQTLNLEKRTDGLWYLIYTVPNVPDGIYNVLLTSTDSENHRNQINLNFTVDNTPPTISGTVTPSIAKSGDSISIDVITSSDTIRVTALILGETFDLYSQSDDGWNLYYSVPDISDGNYPILLTATDRVENQYTTSLNFIVDNTPSVFSGSLTPYTVKTFDNLTITAISDPETASISALILNQTYNLIKQADGTWSLNYTVPYIPDGNYQVLLTALDNAGNPGTFSLNFNVINPIDNISPTVTGNITPNPYQLIDKIYPINTLITIRAFSDHDTVCITALINNQSFNMTRQNDGTWILYYSIYRLNEGNYNVLLTSTDWSGNQGTTLLNFTIVNIHPTIITTVTPNTTKTGNSVTISVTSDPDAQGIYTENANLIKQADGTWKLNYTAPNNPDGNYKIYLTLYYGIGVLPNGYHTLILESVSVSLTIDNTPPSISCSATPNPLRSGDTLKIKVSSSSGNWYLPDDTTNVTAQILGKTFNITKQNITGQYAGTWILNYQVPHVSDGIYPLLITATDLVGNQRTILLNFTVDNTPPVITGTINPNTLKFIDFSTDRSLKITAQSSPDTKAVYALVDNSWRALTYSNGHWTYTFGVPHIVNVGTYTIQLKAIDYAGNEGTTSVSYSVYDNLGLGMGSGSGSNGSTSGSTENNSGGSSGNNGNGSGGSNGGSSGSNEGNSGNNGGSGGSNGGSSGGSSGPGGQAPYNPNALLFFIIMLFILIAIAGLFLAAALFGPEMVIILAALASAGAVVGIPLDAWDIINYAYELIFGHIDLISTMLVLVSLAGIILDAPILLIIIGSIVIFMIVAIILLSYFGGG